MDFAGFASRCERFRRVEGHSDRARRRIRRRRQDSRTDRPERQCSPPRRNDSDATCESLRNDARRVAGSGAAINCVLHKTIKAKDFLPAFLNAIVLAAAGLKLPERFRAIVIGTQSEKPTEWTREFQPMDRDSAIAYLADVVSDLLSTGNDYFLPIEAVEQVVKELDKPEDARDLVDAIERILLNDFSRSSSEYGPVRNATDFDPPGEEGIKEIVARRFYPLVGIFK